MKTPIPLRQISALVVMFVLALCSPGAAETTTTTTTEPFESIIAPSCMGELIPVSGHNTRVEHTTTTTSGLNSRVFHLTVHGSGVGETTGTSYQFTQTTTTVFNRHGTAPIELIREELIHVVSEGNANDFRMRRNVHTVINAQGEVTVSFSDFERVCD
jgi:hypothetical protein